MCFSGTQPLTFQADKGMSRGLSCASSFSIRGSGQLTMAIVVALGLILLSLSGTSEQRPVSTPGGWF